MKLLILSASHNEIDLVLRAKELGIYTVVADWYDSIHSQAKQVADEYWNISWTDIDALEKKCMEEHINGVTGGYSEFVVEAVIKLCECLNLPCYCNMDQLDITRDKLKFKAFCLQNGVPVVHEYNSIDDVNQYPVIIKPTDRAGSIGISVARNKTELEAAYAYAVQASVFGNVIIEDYVGNGTKFDVYYSVVDGEPALLATSDTIMAHEEKIANVVQSVWTYPSKYQSQYKKQIDSSVRKMLSSLGVKNGYFFLSGFAIPEESGVKFVFFECGYRLSGEHVHSYVSACGNPDVRDIFIKHALTGNVSDLKFNDCSETEQLKGVAVNYYIKSGIPETVIGFDDIRAMPDCNYSLLIPVKGVECNEDHAILKKVAMFHFVNTDIEKLKEDIAKANDLFKVLDKEGNDLLYERPESGIIFDE